MEVVGAEGADADDAEVVVAHHDRIGRAPLVAGEQPRGDVVDVGLERRVEAVLPRLQLGEDRDVVGRQRVLARPEGVAELAEVDELHHLRLADDQLRAVLDRLVVVRKAERERVARVVGPLDDVDQLALDEVHQSHSGAILPAPRDFQVRGSSVTKVSLRPSSEPGTGTATRPSSSSSLNPAARDAPTRRAGATPRPRADGGAGGCRRRRAALRTRSPRRRSGSSREPMREVAAVVVDRRQRDFDRRDRHRRCPDARRRCGSGRCPATCRYNCAPPGLRAGGHRDDRNAILEPVHRARAPRRTSRVAGFGSNATTRPDRERTSAQTAGRR